MNDVLLVLGTWVMYRIIHGPVPWREFFHPHSVRKQVRELMKEIDELTKGSVK